MMSGQGKTKSSFLPLQTVCKNRFPFTIACPSFVYPAGYAENVCRLAPFVDEIQLLFFESAPRSLPSMELIRDLSELAVGERIGYNVHLPTDVYPGHPAPAERRRAVEAIRSVVQRCQALRPSTFTLHLESNPVEAPEVPVDHWRQYLLESVQGVLKGVTNPRTICVENLAYPFEWVAPVIESADLSVCMDMGHLLAHGIDLEKFYGNWKERIATVHLHGVDGTNDHLPLDRLSDQNMAAVVGLLKRFGGVVVVENYSQPALNASLAVLADHWPRLEGEGI